MSLKDPIHFVFGYVELTAENGFPERFVNLCTAHGIPLWDMHKSGSKIHAKTTIGGYRKIRTPAKGSSMRIHLTKKHGLPFLTDKVLRRTGLAIGFSIMLVTLAFLSGRVWIIQVDNSTDIPSEEIVNAYEAAGLKIGISKRADVEEIRLNAITELDEISWTTVNITGSVATIKIEKFDEAPEQNIANGTSNIIATKDGQIEIVEPYRGSSAVKLGQTVMEGDLLISGVTESRIQSYIFSDADGYVVASTQIDVQSETPQIVTECIPSVKKVYSVYILGREIPLGRSKQSDICYFNKSRLYIGGKELPFGINYRIYYTFTKKQTKLNQTEQRLNAINDYALLAYNKTLHAQRISNEVKIESENGNITICGSYYCYENICRKQQFEVEETEVADENKNS